MKIDKLMAVSIIGALSTIPYEMLTRVLKLVGYAEYSVYELSSLMVTLNRPDIVLGSFLSMILGASIAIILYYAVIGRFGWNNILFKSVFINFQSLVFLEFLFMWLIEGRNLIPFRPIKDYYSHIFCVSIYGLILGLLFQKYIKTK